MTSSVCRFNFLSLLNGNYLSNLNPQVGAYHLNVKIDSVVAAMTNLFAAITGRMPRFRCARVCNGSGGVCVFVFCWVGFRGARLGEPGSSHTTEAPCVP